MRPTGLGKGGLIEPCFGFRRRRPKHAANTHITSLWMNDGQIARVIMLVWLICFYLLILRANVTYSLTCGASIPSPDSGGAPQNIVNSTKSRCMLITRAGLEKVRDNYILLTFLRSFPEPRMRMSVQ